MDSAAKSNGVVQQITRNVIRKYAGLEAANELPLPASETASATKEAALHTDAG
jgi:hypothetical protein